MIKEKYEISLWEDKLIPEINDIPSHFEEEKVAVIGSNSMTADCRAIEPRLVENINGTHTFTFKMFYVYTDDYGKKYQNPFLNLLVNERKVKVLWKDTWYDFVIKNCQENSEDKSITYTCTDLFINELSKTGFDLVLDGELKNNQGTPVELAQYVLEGTDWTVDTINSDIIKQEKEEPVYEVVTNKPFTFDNQTTGGRTAVPEGATVLVYYQQIQDFLNSSQTSGNYTIQFAYASEYKRESNSQLVVNADCLVLEEQLWTKIDNYIQLGGANGVYWGKIYYEEGVSENYRASRLVQSKVSVADPITGKYCYLYNGYVIAEGDRFIEGKDYYELINNNYVITQDTQKNPNKTYYEINVFYGFEAAEYNDPTVVINLLVNAENIDGKATGWEGNNLDISLWPLYTESSPSFSSSTTYFRLLTYNSTTNDGLYKNLGLTQSSRVIPNGFIKGQKYIFRYKAVADDSDHPDPGNYYLPNTGKGQITISIKDKDDNEYFTVSNASVDSEEHWVEFICTCTTSISRMDLYTKQVKLYLKNTGSKKWLEQAQFFQLYYGEKTENEQTITVRLNPNEMDTQSIATIYYTYYNHTQAEALHITKLEDLTFTYKDTVPDTTMIPVVNENFEKIRSITAKQSNRFNIIQTIAETFECWARFIIDHDQGTGKITYINGIAQKRVVFKKDIGQEVGVGFIYGIDLKGIQRTIQSDQIVTKTIVSPNNNEFAPNGFCTIARSIENFPRTNFILNFDYYISQGLLNGGELNKDLYNDIGMGYYFNLNNWNKEYDGITEELTQRQSELLKQESFLTVYDGMITSINEQINAIEIDVKAKTNKATWAAAVKYINTNKTDDTNLKGQVVAHDNLVKNLATYNSMYSALSDSIDKLKGRIREYQETQETIVGRIKAKHLEFYTKYSRYIQEGSWISQDYIDDNLYYLDALSVAYTSSRPQISYNISVLRLSALEEFKNKVFHLGDISFIQDTEFFGYARNTTDVNSVITPYKEKVLVAEVTSYFDEPEKDSFKVQNYKTQFEDLFQRITSTTQSLQYSSGEYARAASIVEPNGTIKAESLQASFALNQQLVYSANNESVVWDNTGVTVSDTTNPNRQTKVTSGGLFITTDGGATWKNAVRSDGTATEYLTSGTINTENINIMNGSFPSFRWDQNGINAYAVTGSGGGANFYFDTAVRFDQFGLYGINGYTGDVSNFNPVDEDFIWNSNYTRFGLTWKGFFLKNNNGSVEINSEDDIVVKDGNTIRVKIGRLSGTSPNYVYGIRISDSSGAPVLVTNSDGNLWLQNMLQVGSSSAQNATVQIGYNPTTTRPTTQYHEVIHAGTAGGNEFIVYEDGYLKASGGTFTGTIEATGGRIGNVYIEDFVDAAYKVVITSNGGTTFKKQNGSITPSIIILTATLYKGSQAISSGVTYQWYINNSQVQEGGTSQTLTVNGSTFSGDEVKVYRCDVQYSG